MTERGHDEGLAGLARRHRPEDFDASYAGTPPWDIGRPQPAFVELADAGLLQGRVLDVGCGTGEHALMAAARGFDAVGIDMAAAAIEVAQNKARQRGLAARFVVADALALQTWDERFETVLDSALFHVFGDDERPVFVEGLAAVVPAGGHYYMLCFSDRQPGDWGPRRITRAEITANFRRGWQIDSIEPATLEINISPEPVLAWRVAITRT